MNPCTFVGDGDAQVVFTVARCVRCTNTKQQGPHERLSPSSPGQLRRPLRELYMKSRICFYFAAVVALVLFVAAISSHATERRDPLIAPESQQMQSAKTTHQSHAKSSQKKPAVRNAQRQSASSAPSAKGSAQGVNPSFEGKDQMGSETPSSSGKSSRTSAGK